MVSISARRSGVIFACASGMYFWDDKRMRIYHQASKSLTKSITDRPSPASSNVGGSCSGRHCNTFRGKFVVMSKLSGDSGWQKT